MRATLALAFLLAVASPAFASQCPADMAAIDAALQTAQLSDADMAKVKELRAQGQQLHEAGQHGQSDDALGQAKALLGL